MQYEAIKLRIEGALARVTLATPAMSNRVGLRGLQELQDACEVIDRSAGVSLVVVDAVGQDFCAGWADDAREQLARTRDLLDPFGCLARLPVPVLAALHGAVTSAGLEMALACDLRVARDDARFSSPEAAAGMVPLAGATARLPRIAGRTAASAMLLLGAEFDAPEAYRCGLVSRVIETEGFTAAIEALVARITANGPLGLRYAKEAIHNGMELPLDQALRYELDLSVILQTTHDRAEGVEAFLAKRQPRFEGR